MNKYSKFSTSPITPSTKVVASLPYADVKPTAIVKNDEPLTAVDALQDQPPAPGKS